MIVHCVMIAIALPLCAQKKIPYHYFHESDSSSKSTKLLTEVRQPSSTFLRLYFAGTELGPESYLLLEASDGHTQKLRRDDLENWSYSSAYFNGESVKVSLFTAKGERNKVSINEVNVSDKKTMASDQENARKALSGGATSNARTNIELNELPHAAAVGRFSNGVSSYGAGWIAPNGAIVTSADQVLALTNSPVDIIEFNVPPSDSYGNVSHPGPEDQYPVKYRNETQSSYTFDFKNKHNFHIVNEEEASFGVSWGILDALPNSTGLRPGERQQQYFRIATNLGSFTLGSKDISVDILHYGETENDLIDGGANYRTLKRYITKLEPQGEYVASAGLGEVEDIMIYNLNGGSITISDSDKGAPITYSGYNIAMGIHDDFHYFAPGVGLGFKSDALLSTLNDYYSSATTYVDQNSLWDDETGAIDKPYLSVQNGIDHADVGGVVNIVKGNYHESLYINKAVTLKAPVGTVVLGAPGMLSGRMASFPRELLLDPAGDDLATISTETSDFGLSSYPNPFSGGTTVGFDLPKGAKATVQVYDKWGNKVRTLFHDISTAGSHSVVWDGLLENGAQAGPGLYVIRLETPGASKAMKVIKE